MTYKQITRLSEAKEMEELYNQSFIKDERIEFNRLLTAPFDGFILIGQYYEGKLVGMMHYICKPEFVQLNYFAITPNTRGHGYGSKCLNWLKQQYPNKSIVVEVEDLDDECDNNEYRKKRQAFYNKNGLEKGLFNFWWEGVYMTCMHYLPIDRQAYLRHISKIYTTAYNIVELEDMQQYGEKDELTAEKAF